MNPQDKFDEANSIMKAPKGMENCVDLKTWKGNQQDGTPVIISKWKPTDDELLELMNGGSVYLYVVGEQMPPVSLQVQYPFFYTDNLPDIYKSPLNEAIKIIEDVDKKEMDNLIKTFNKQN